jgi:hypothetical protein
MNLAQAMHTAARRYCIDQFAYWSNRYSAMSRQGTDRIETDDGWEYTPEALGIFPRYNVLRAIGVEIERLNPERLEDFVEARELLLAAGITADDEFTRNPIDHIAANTALDEREAFCRFIRNVSEVELGAIEPLPYRRVLSTEESDQIWSRLRQAWRISEGYWYPLAEGSLSNIAAFQDKPFYKAVSPDLLRRILKAHKIERLWELRESGAEYEQDTSLFQPYYNGTEGYWSSDESDWIIYVSHESSVTIGGWLLDDIKARWPSWEKNVWTSPFF